MGLRKGTAKKSGSESMKSQRNNQNEPVQLPCKEFWSVECRLNPSWLWPAAPVTWFKHGWGPVGQSDSRGVWRPAEEECLLALSFYGAIMLD